MERYRKLDSEGGEQSGLVRTFISKVANILGLDFDEGPVANAMEQAHQEMREEAHEQHLQWAVDNGRITEEDAKEIRKWLRNRPEAMRELGVRGHPHHGLY